MHQRQAIINKIVALLTGITGLPAPKELDEKPSPTQPVLRVYAAGETPTRKTEMEDERKLRIEVRMAANRAEGFQTTLNDMSKLVEDKLALDPQLDETASSFEYLGMAPNVGDVGDIDSASMVLMYEATYIYTPTITAEDFLTMSLEIDMAGPRNDPQLPAEPDDQIDASATITLPT